VGYYEERRQEILDGKRSWNILDSGGDADVFYTEFVLPLRKLRDEGTFEKLIELKVNRRGAQIISRVDIHGAINLEA
jgi:hypothetical protein